MNKIRTSVAEMFIDDNGILHIEMFAGAKITPEKVTENFAGIKKLLGDNKALTLITTKGGFQFRSEARRYAAMNLDSVNRTATAFVVKSFADKLVVNLYIKFNKPVVPTRMFLSEENALKWLQTFFIMPGDEYLRPKRKK